MNSHHYFESKNSVRLWLDLTSSRRVVVDLSDIIELKKEYNVECGMHNDILRC